MEKEHGQSLRVPGTLTRELTMMPVWKSLSEGKHPTHRIIKKSLGVFTGLAKGHLLSTQTGKARALCA